MSCLQNAVIQYITKTSFPIQWKKSLTKFTQHDNSLYCMWNIYLEYVSY